MKLCYDSADSLRAKFLNALLSRRYEVKIITFKNNKEYQKYFNLVCCLLKLENV